MGRRMISSPLEKQEAVMGSGHEWLEQAWAAGKPRVSKVKGHPAQQVGAAK